MSITVTGTLITPADVSINSATIRFIATSNSDTGTVKGTYTEFPTNGSGVYSKVILPGTYRVDFKYDNKYSYITLGNATIADSDSGSHTLQSLLSSNV
jgi:hypothetical protein